MVKRDTRDARRRASLATSSMTNSADSRAPALCCHIRVIELSTAQMHFWMILVRESASKRRGGVTGGMPNDPTTRAPFMNAKPKTRFEGSQRDSVKRTGRIVPRKKTGTGHGRTAATDGGRDAARAAGAML